MVHIGDVLPFISSKGEWPISPKTNSNEGKRNKGKTEGGGKGRIRSPLAENNSLGEREAPIKTLTFSMCSMEKGDTFPDRPLGKHRTQGLFLYQEKRICV